MALASCGSTLAAHRRKTMDDDMVLTTVALKLKIKKKWDCLRFKVLETLAPSTAT